MEGISYLLLYYLILKLKARRNLNPDKYMGNRIPQWYDIAIPDVFGIKTSFSRKVSFEIIKNKLKRNISTMLCLKRPGHFVAVVAVDTEKNELIYNDPWPGNYWPRRLKGTSSFNRRMRLQEFKNNTENFAVYIG